MKITIVGRNDHSRYIADQYEKNNILGEYYSLYFFKNNILGNILKKINPNIEFVNKNIKINEKKIKSLFLIILIKRIFKKIKVPDTLNSYITDNIYDFYVSCRIKEADYYHLWSQYSYFTMKKIRKKYPNAKIILDFYCAHPSYRSKIYSENKILKNFKISETYLLNKINKEIQIADYIICPSEHIKESILDSSKKEKENIKIIKYGANYKNFYKIQEEKLIRSKKFTILFVGQISGHKGVNYLIEAVEELNEKYKNIKLMLIGKKEGVYKNISFTPYKFIQYIGTVENNKLNEYYNQADLFVFPSLSESWGLVVSEAISCGLPVITTRNAKNLIENLENGLIIKENNLKELKDAIEYMYINEEFRIKCSLKNLEVSKMNNHNWENYFKDLKKSILI